MRFATAASWASASWGVAVSASRPKARLMRARRLATVFGSERDGQALHALAVVGELLGRKRNVGEPGGGRALLQAHQAIARGVRQGLKEDAVHHREDGGVGADAERQRQDDDDGEAAAAHEPAGA